MPAIDSIGEGAFHARRLSESDPLHPQKDDAEAVLPMTPRRLGKSKPMIVGDVSFCNVGHARINLWAGG